MTVDQKDDFYKNYKTYEKKIVELNKEINGLKEKERNLKRKITFEQNL